MSRHYDCCFTLTIKKPKAQMSLKVDRVTQYSYGCSSLKMPIQLLLSQWLNLDSLLNSLNLSTGIISLQVTNIPLHTCWKPRQSCSRQYFRKKKIIKKKILQLYFLIHCLLSTSPFNSYGLNPKLLSVHQSSMRVSRPAPCRAPSLRSSANLQEPICSNQVSCSQAASLACSLSCSSAFLSPCHRERKCVFHKGVNMLVKQQEFWGRNTEEHLSLM